MEGGVTVSAIRAQMASRVRRTIGLAGALEPAGALHGAGGPVSDRGSLRVRALVLWGALAAVLLALALGASLQRGPARWTLRDEFGPALRRGLARQARDRLALRATARRQGSWEPARAGARTGL